MRFITAPQCACCGLPFEFDVAIGMICGACADRAPFFDRARSVLVYDDASRQIVLRFKHADQTDLAPIMAGWMQSSAAKLINNCDLLVPVPLHWTRLFKRRYNQSAMLALTLAKISGRPVKPDVLVRKKRTPSQGHLSSHQRRKNVQGAFFVTSKLKPMIKGQRILLIDDVYTTGATVDACAKTLLGAGARGVDVLTFARAVKSS